MPKRDCRKLECAVNCSSVWTCIDKLHGKLA